MATKRRRPFMEMISEAFEDEGRRVPTSLMKRERALDAEPTLDDLSLEPERGEKTVVEGQRRGPTAEMSSGTGSTEETQPGYRRGLLADPMTDSLSWSASRRLGGVRFLPPEEGAPQVEGEPSGPLPVVVGRPVAGGSLSGELLSGEEEVDPLDELPEGMQLDDLSLDEPVYAAPEHTVTLDEETLRQLHAQILATVEVGPRDTVPDLPEILRASGAFSGLSSLSGPGENRSATGSYVVTDTLVVDAFIAPPSPPPDADEPEPFTLSGLTMARPTEVGPQGDLARKAFKIFEAAIEDWRCGRRAAAHTNAMLARVYDPGCEVYRRAAAWWGHLVRTDRDAPYRRPPPRPIARPAPTRVEHEHSASDG